MKPPKAHIGLSAMLLCIAVIMLLMGTCGCSTAYKTARDTKKLDGLAVQYPTEEARLANWLYPCFTGKAKSDTVITHGKADTTVSYSKLFGGSVLSTVDLNNLPDSVKAKWSAIAVNPQYGEYIPDSLSIMPNPTVRDFRIVHDTVVKTIRIRIPIYTTIHDTVTNDRAINDVKLQLAAANKRADKAEQQLADNQKSLNTWRWIAIACMVLIFGTIVWKIYKLFNGGAVASAVTEIKKL